jgi:hypothetical protein
MTDGNDLAIVTIDGDYRWLVQHYTAVGPIDQCIDSPQIDSELVSEKLFDELHGDGSSSKLAGFQEASISFRRQLVCLNERLINRRGIFFEVGKTYFRRLSRAV